MHGECIHGQKKIVVVAMGLYTGGTIDGRTGLPTEFYRRCPIEPWLSLVASSTGENFF